MKQFIVKNINPTAYQKSIKPIPNNNDIYNDIGWLIYNNIGWFDAKHPSQQFLVHLSQRLIGELIGYSWSGVRPSSVRPSFVNNFKHLLCKCLANQSQILCGASWGELKFVHGILVK